MSISRFEKLIPDVEKLGSDERKLLAKCFPESLELFRDYLTARDSAEAERQIFRGSVKAVSLSASIEAISKGMAPKEEN
jgi:hypothetical protein